MMELFSINSFTNQLDAGNPAGVCLSKSVLTEEKMKLIAAQMNLSETAFVTPKDNGYSVRWFTPSGVEVDLCGHATLAAAHAIWESNFLDPQQTISFDSRSGILYATKLNDKIQLDFPLMPIIDCEHSQLVREALQLNPVNVVQNQNSYYLVELENESLVRTFTPNFSAIATLPLRGVIITAKSDRDYDFVSRFFVPKIGIPEDPVTGAAHTMLVNYWSNKLNKNTFVAYQASKRGGMLWLERKQDRVFIKGQTITFFKTTLNI